MHCNATEVDGCSVHTSIFPMPLQLVTGRSQANQFILRVLVLLLATLIPYLITLISSTDPRSIPRTSAPHGETLQRTRPRQFGKSAILESVRPQVRDTIFGTSVCWVFPQMLFPMDDSSMRWIWRSFRSAFGLIKLQLDSRQIRFLAGHITSLRLFLCKNQFIHFLTSLLPSLRSGLSRTYLLCGYLIITCIIKKGDWDKQQYHREEEEET